MVVTTGVNGVVNFNHGSAGTALAEHQKRQRNYRLIVDPALKQGPTKVYSIEGHIPGVSMLVLFLCFSLI